MDANAPARIPAPPEMTIPLTGVRHVDVAVLEGIASELQSEMARLAEVRQDVLKKLSELNASEPSESPKPKPKPKPRRHFSDLSLQVISLAASLKGLDKNSPEYIEKNAQLELLKAQNRKAIKLRRNARLRELRAARASKN
jgi:hypothetical protein